MKKRKWRWIRGKAILLSFGIVVLLLVAVLIINQQESIRKAIFQPESRQSEEEAFRYLDTELTLEFMQFADEEKQAVLDDINRLQRS